MTPAQAETALVEDIAGFQHDPLGFVLFAFPWGEGELADEQGPREWQADELRELGEQLRAGVDPEERSRFIASAIKRAVSSGHGVGKSAEVSWLTLWAMSTMEDTRGVITANTDGQLRKKTWPELSKWYRLCITKHWFHLTKTALYSVQKDHEETWRIDAVPWSDHNTEAFAGLHNKGKRILLIFDEASAVSDKIWEVSEGALTDENTEIIWCVFGNPTRNTGRFRECWRKFRARWSTRSIDSRDVDGTNLEQIQQWIEDYGLNSDFVKIRVRGMFPDASFKQFISASLVDAAWGLHLRKDQYSFAPIIITCDPAWSGDDSLVIAKRQGLWFEVLDVLPKNDDDVGVANKIARYEDEFNADAVFVDGGYGTGIVSAAKAMNRAWTLVWFGSASAEPGCVCKRDEMWYLMRQWLKDGGAIPEDDVLRTDLTGVETISRLDGKIKLMSKEDMKKLGLPSPNHADALALSFAYPVVKKDRAMVQMKQVQAITGHKPYKSRNRRR